MLLLLGVEFHCDSVVNGDHHVRTTDDRWLSAHIFSIVPDDFETKPKEKNVRRASDIVELTVIFCVGRFDCSTRSSTISMVGYRCCWNVASQVSNYDHWRGSKSEDEGNCLFLSELDSRTFLVNNWCGHRFVFVQILIDIRRCFPITGHWSRWICVYWPGRFVDEENRCCENLFQVVG